MVHPAVGFGRPFAASLPATPYNRAASAFAWSPLAARAAAQHMRPRGPAAAQPSATPPAGDAMPGFDLEALLEAIRAALAEFLGLSGAEGAGSAAEGTGGGTLSPDEPAFRPAASRPERDGRAFGGSPSERAIAAGGRAASSAVRSGAAAGSSATGPAGGLFGSGPVDLSGGIGLGLGALGMMPGPVGLVGTLAGAGLRVNNMLAAQQMLEDAGLPGYDALQWAGGVTGLNSYGSGSPNSPIGYMDDGTAITPSGYQYGTDGPFGPVLDAFGLGDGWSTAMDPHNAALEAAGVTHHNWRQMPMAMTDALRARRPPSTGTPTGGSAQAGSRPADVSAHAGGAGFTQKGGPRSAGGGGGTSPSASAGRSAAQVA